MIFIKKKNSKTFTEKNMNKVFYYYGKETTIDILCHKIIKSNKIDNNLLELCKLYQSKITPVVPVSADVLIKKYQIPEGRKLGEKLRAIEEEWVENNFQISEQQINNIINN